MLALTLMAVAACASQAEITRLRQEVADLQKQLEVEKQRQAVSEERLRRAKGNAGKKDGRAH